MWTEQALEEAKSRGLIPTVTGAYVFRAEIEKPAALKKYAAERYGDLSIYAQEGCVLLKKT